MSSIYLKTSEKAVILEEREGRSLYFYAKFYSLSLGLLFLYESYRFFRFLLVFLKTKRIWRDSGERVISSIYFKRGEKSVISKQRVVRCLYY